MQLKFVFASHSRTLEVTENSSHYTYKQEKKVFVVVEEDCLHADDIYVHSHFYWLCISRHSPCQY